MRYILTSQKVVSFTTLLLVLWAIQWNVFGLNYSTFTPTSTPTYISNCQSHQTTHLVTTKSCQTSNLNAIFFSHLNLIQTLTVSIVFLFILGLHSFLKINSIFKPPKLFI